MPVEINMLYVVCWECSLLNNNQTSENEIKMQDYWEMKGNNLYVLFFFFFFPIAYIFRFQRQLIFYNNWGLFCQVFVIKNQKDLVASERIPAGFRNFSAKLPWCLAHNWCSINIRWMKVWDNIFTSEDGIYGGRLGQQIIFLKHFAIWVLCRIPNKLEI